MSIADSILPEFDQEMAGTRKVLERVPNDKLDWKAHPKSNTIGWVASHLADIPGWVGSHWQEIRSTFAPPGKEPYRTKILKSREEMLATFDNNVAEARTTIAATPDAKFHESWSLLKGGEKIFSLPKITVFRSFIMNHSIHHRAILCVYLRLNDMAVPGMYGPSGDET